jgi:hypothetical protein
MNYIINTTNLIHLLLSHFITVQTLDMFGALLAHLQETLHERRFGDYCVRLCCGLDSGCGKIVMNFVIQMTQNHI